MSKSVHGNPIRPLNFESDARRGARKRRAAARHLAKIVSYRCRIITKQYYSVVW